MPWIYWQPGRTPCLTFRYELPRQELFRLYLAAHLAYVERRYLG